ncbi:30294_t:CDS:2 [Gigaspora margarita]|uniref:30294_t:CDS:1 n=1 Tax=Gigaspora margarita TaxID=4874 RepID=A0ABN7UPG9_GIGMA|nr:30294_t:CDS:2 [Gigaspora margarita]
MDAGKKLIIVDTSFKFLIDDLFNKRVMFDKPPVETIKGILQTNKFIKKHFMDMVQKKFIEILGYDPRISFFALLRYWISSNENYYEFSFKVKNKYLSRDVQHILERITLKGSFFYFKHCLCGIERSIQTKSNWVNSEWFCEASPLVWYDPFSNKTKTRLAIGTYIQEMSLQEKQIIKKHFNISRFVFKSLLPYSSFLRLINISNFMDAVINFWQKFRKNSRDRKITMISELLIQLMLNKSTKIQQFKFADLYFFVYPELGNSLVKLVEIQNGLKHFSLTNTYNNNNTYFLNALQYQLHSLSYLEFNSVEFIQVSLIGFIKKCQSLSKLAIFNSLFENEGDQNNLIDQVPIKQLVIYNSTAPVIKLILLCNSSLETLKIIDFSIGLITFNIDYLEISWAPSLQYLILYQNHFVVNLKSMKLGDYLEKLAKSLPLNMKVIKIWIILQGYEEEVKLDDLCKFFSYINFRRLFVLLEIAVPYNSQVVSKSIQFD